MTDTFDYSGLASHVRAIALPHHASDVLRTRIEAAFVPLHRYETVYAVAAEQGLARVQATARAEAAEARVKVLEEALVEAVIPLEAMRIAGVTQTLCVEMREGIENAVQCIRQTLGAEHDK